MKRSRTSRASPARVGAPRSTFLRPPDVGMLAAVPWVEFVLLALLLAFALWLRIDHNGYGLPSVFYQDEDTHAVRPAVHVIAGHVAPKRLENPTAFTYLLAPAFHVQDVGLLFGR